MSQNFGQNQNPQNQNPNSQQGFGGPFPNPAPQGPQTPPNPSFNDYNQPAQPYDQNQQFAQQPAYDPNFAGQPQAQPDFNQGYDPNAFAQNPYPEQDFNQPAQDYASPADFPNDQNNTFKVKKTGNKFLVIIVIVLTPPLI